MHSLKKLFIPGLTLVLTGILLFIAKPCFAGNTNDIDSLKRSLVSTNNLDDRIRIYVRLASLYQSINPDSASGYANAALKLAGSKTSPELMGRIYHALGNLAVMKDSLDKARESYLQAVSYFTASKTWPNLADDYLLLGNISLVKDQLVDALDYYRKGVALAEKYNYEGPMGDFYMNIGNIHSEAHNYPDALHYYTLAKEAFQHNANTPSVGIALENIGQVYYDLNELNTALENYRLAVSIFTERRDHFNLGETYSKMARVYVKMNNHSQALQLLDSCLREMEQVGTGYAGPKDVTLAGVYATLGHVNLVAGNSSDALNYLRKGYVLSQKNDQLAISSDICFDISRYFEKYEMPDSSIYYYKLYHSYYGKHLDEDNIRKLAYQSAEFKFEQQAKAVEVERLKSEANSRKIQLILALVIAGLIIGLGIFYFFYKLGKTKLQQSQLEKQNIANELEFRNKELTTTVMHQVKNTEFILRIAEKLKQSKITDHPVYRGFVNEILSEIEFDSNTDAWKEFEISFQRVHVDFYKKLGENYPDLSSNELRLCAYLKLNLGTKDIAAITYQSTNSIDVARHRLRNKLGLKKEESLAAFLSRF
jgi:tetratricopeptide (TPR) repeat protein/DNA-binding CsgD family transcriptional regulator